MEYRPRRPLWVKPSIRPRRCRRGERSTRRLRHDPRGAPSIRPRRCRRGEPTKSAATPTSRFTFNSASTLSSRRTADPEGASEVVNDILQFGLDAVVGENPRSRPTWPSRTSSPFNSASTLSSRRTADPNVLWAWCVRLQFGLDAVVEENSTPSTTNFARCGPLQFGLDAVVEENADSDPAPVQTVQAFNSASTLSSRRTGFGFNPKTRSGGLQFGLDAVVEENAGGPDPRRPRRRASIRPRRCRRGERRCNSVTAGRGTSFNSASTLSSRRTCPKPRSSSRAPAGFNSASTLSSRRTRTGPESPVNHRRRFNSASTLSSRRTPLKAVHPRHRPRFNSASTLSSRRTHDKPVAAAFAAKLLQFGLDAVVEENRVQPLRATPSPCFNSASTLSSRRTRPHDRTGETCPGLQFGLDAVVEENADRQGHAEGEAGASIRPRRCRRGEHADRVPGERPADPASIRPRRCRRGERTTRRPSRTRRRCFNSASTLSSRRTDPTPAGRQERGNASIRPRRCRRGELPAHRQVADRGRPASIRPRRCRRGESGPCR